MQLQGPGHGSAILAYTADDKATSCSTLRSHRAGLGARRAALAKCGTCAIADCMLELYEDGHDGHDGHVG